MIKNISVIPLVSIIVPIYNSEKTLDRCLTSINQQKYENLEVVLINDGSTDRSFEIAKKYARKTGKIKIFSQKNLGVAVAKENGVKYSTGDYITFVDSDDYILPNYISDFVAAVYKSHCDICVSGYYTLEDKKLKKHLLSDSFFSFNKKEAMSNLLKDGFGDFFCNKFFSRKVMNHFKLEHGKNYEDIRECYKLFEYANVFSYVPSLNYIYVLHLGSITSTLSQQNRYDLYEAKLKQYMFFKNIGYVNAEIIAYPSLLEASLKYLLFCGKLRNKSYDIIAWKLISKAKLKSIPSIRLKILIILFKIWRK